MQCYRCFGAGSITSNVTCPTCHGKGSYWKAVGLRNMWEPCYQCGGRRSVRTSGPCPTCGGTGRLPDVVASGGPIPFAPPQPTPAPDPALLQLQGKWKALGSRYEFVKQNDGYHVTQFNFLGMKVAEGEAAASGGTLRLTLRNPFTGPITLDLELNGDQLTGRAQGLMPVPVTLKRAA